MSVETTADQVQQKVLTGLIANFVNQGHLLQYAQGMATSIGLNKHFFTLD